MARAEGRRRLVLEEIARVALLHRAESLDLTPTQTVDRLARRCFPQVIVLTRVVVGIDAQTLRGEEIPPWRARFAALGRDDDDAVRRLRAVERCGRRSLHDLNVLDLFRIEVVEEARSPPTDAGLPDVVRVDARTALLHPHTVDDHEWIVRQRSGTDAANPNACSAANTTVRLDERYTGGAAVQHVLHCRDRLLLHELRGLDLRDGVSQLAGELLSRGGRDDCFELEWDPGEHEIECRLLRGGDVRALLDGLIADRDRAHGVAACGQAAYQVDALLVRLCAQVRADDLDLRERDGLSGLFVGDLACEPDLIGLRESRPAAESSGERDDHRASSVHDDAGHGELGCR